MLTPEELEQIRQIVREEIKAAIKIDVSRLKEPGEPLKGVLRTGAPGDYRVFNGPPLGPTATLEEIKNRFREIPDQW